MTRPRQIHSALAIIVVVPITLTAAAAQDAAKDLGRCAAISDSAGRLRCYDAVPSPSPPPRSQGVGAWRLVRTPNPRGGADAVSIMHTADVRRSDLDLAGLTLRCGENGVEVLVVVVEPRPPRAQLRVTVGVAGDSAAFTASMVPPFSILLLPGEAAARITGAWKLRPELTVQIAGDGPTVHGVVPLAGLAAALQSLEASCPSR
jgi:hypothetical protein